jgi:hypothetical protein
VEAALGGSARFGNKPNGVFRHLYEDLCRYAHSRPGFTNGDIWQSNGPVFVGSGCTQFWLDYCDTLLACSVLFKIRYPALKLPKAVRSIPGAAGASWHGLAPQAVAAYLP